MDCGEVGGSAACQVNPAQQTAAHATVPPTLAVTAVGVGDVALEATVRGA